MFTKPYLADIGEVLLAKKETLREELEREYAERTQQLDEMLASCGYVADPVEETVDVVGTEVMNGEAVY